MIKCNKVFYSGLYGILIRSGIIGLGNVIMFFSALPSPVILIMTLLSAFSIVFGAGKVYKLQKETKSDE